MSMHSEGYVVSVSVCSMSSATMLYKATKYHQVSYCNDLILKTMIFSEVNVFKNYGVKTK